MRDSYLEVHGDLLKGNSKEVGCIRFTSTSFFGAYNHYYHNYFNQSTVMVNNINPPFLKEFFTKKGRGYLSIPAPSPSNWKGKAFGDGYFIRHCRILLINLFSNAKQVLAVSLKGLRSPLNNGWFQPIRQPLFLSPYLFWKNVGNPPVLGEASGSQRWRIGRGHSFSASLSPGAFSWMGLQGSRAPGDCSRRLLAENVSLFG